MPESYVHIKFLGDVGRDHVAHTIVASLRKNIEGVWRATRTKETLYRREVGTVHGLVEEPNELSERLVNKEQITQWNVDHAVSRNGVQTVFDALSHSAVF